MNKSLFSGISPLLGVVFCLIITVKGDFLHTLFANLFNIVSKYTTGQSVSSPVVFL